MADWSDRLEFTLTVEFGAGRASIIHAEILPESCHDHAALQLANLLDDGGDLCYPLSEEEAERPTVACVFRDDAARATERVRAAADSAGLAVRVTPASGCSRTPSAASRSASGARSCATRTTRASRAGCHAT